ncbi:unnamed protein product [Brassica oleracea]
MPIFIQIQIILFLAKDSIEAFHNVLTAFPGLGTAAKSPLVLKHLNLQFLTVQSLSSLNMYQNLMNLCVSAGNLEAHYLRGMQEYFQKENIADGLAHLQITAQGLYDNAIYLYGIIMLSRGDPAIGKPLLDSLGWRENKARSDACWQSIKTSIHGVRVKRFEIYITTYKATSPTINCHRNNIAIRCETCYYFKQMKKIVFH